MLARLAILSLLLPALAGCGSNGSRQDVQRDLRLVMQEWPRSGPEHLQALEAERARARDAGIALTLTELARPPVPAERNAAVLYRELAAVMEEQSFAQAEELLRRLSLRYAPTADELAQARRILEERADLLALARRAARRPECDFESDWSAWPHVPVPEDRALRRAGVLFRAEGFLLTSSGDYTGALAALADGLRAERHAASQPTTIGLLTAQLSRGLTLIGLRDLLYLAGPDAEMAEAVRRLLAEHPPATDFRRTTARQAAIDLQRFDQLRVAGPRGLADYLTSWSQPTDPETLPSMDDLPPAERRAWENFVAACEADYLRRLRELLEVLDLPLAERAAALRRLEPERTAQFERAVTAPQAVSNLLLPWASTARRHLQWRGDDEVLAAGAAVLAYRAREGRFPERLEEALPEPPRDPFTGEPFVYEREESGFVIYSRGPDGDLPAPPKDAWFVRDQGFFRYPAPPPED